jgi:hypothetical protein
MRNCDRTLRGTRTRLRRVQYAKRPNAEHPEIPLHTNGSENDIRCQVTKRHVSGGTRSDIGRDCRDAFLGLAKAANPLIYDTITI